MPDHGFGRCDGHHEMVDFQRASVQPTTHILSDHNGGKNLLKNKSAERFVPIHSKLVRAGLLQYAAALPKGSLLFPGLSRRASKGGKISARVGELFAKKLKSLGIKRERLVFHCLRHMVGACLDRAGVRREDAARIMGHAVPGITFGVYGEGDLTRLAGIMQDALKYDLPI
jgi:integrase